MRSEREIFKTEKLIKICVPKPVTYPGGLRGLDPKISEKSKTFS